MQSFGHKQYRDAGRMSVILSEFCWGFFWRGEISPLIFSYLILSKVTLLHKYLLIFFPWATQCKYLKHLPQLPTLSAE